MRADYYEEFPAGAGAMVGLEHAARPGGLEAWCEALTELPRTGAQPGPGRVAR